MESCWSKLVLMLWVTLFSTVYSYPQTYSYNVSAAITAPQQGATLTIPIHINLQIQLDPQQQNTINYAEAPTAVSAPTSMVEIFKIYSSPDKNNLTYLEDLDCSTCTIAGVNADYMTIHRVVPLNGPFQKIGKCEVTQAEINGIADTLNKFLEGDLSVRHDAPARAPGADAPDRCQESLQKVRTSLNGMMDIYSKHKDGSGVTASDYNKMRENYRNQVNELNNELALLKKQSEDSKRISLDELDKAKQKFHKNFDEINTKLVEVITKRQEELVVLIGDAIFRKQFNLAIEKLNDIDDKSNIMDIVKEAYSVESIDNILIFAQRIPAAWSYDAAHVACSQLARLIAEDYSFTSPNVLLADSFIKSLKTTDKRTKEFKEESLKKLEDTVRRVLAIWADNIMSDKTDQIVEFANKRNGIIGNYLVPLVGEVWKRYNFRGKYTSGLEKSEKVMDLADRLEVEHAQPVWNELLSKVKANSKVNMAPLLRIAYNEYKASRTFIEGIPQNWKRIIAGDEVCIINIEQNYQLWETTENHSDKHNVYSAKTSMDWGEKYHTSISFAFETSTKGKTWLIKSSKDGNYMSPSGDSFDTWKRKLFTHMNGKRQDDGEWEIIQVSDVWDKNEYYINSVKYNEYLAIDENEDFEEHWIKNTFVGTRNAFTWRVKTKPPNYKWEIRGCKCTKENCLFDAVSTARVG